MGDGQRHIAAVLPPGTRQGTHRIGGWVGRRTGLDGCENLHPAGFDFPTVPHIASRYTD